MWNPHVGMLVGGVIHLNHREGKIEVDGDTSVGINSGGWLTIIKRHRLGRPRASGRGDSIALDTEHKFLQVKGHRSGSLTLRGGHLGYLQSQQAYSAFSFHPGSSDANIRSIAGGPSPAGSNACANKGGFLAESARIISG